MLNNTKYKKFLIAGFAALLLIILINSLRSKDLAIDVASEGTSTNYSSQANINNGEELLKTIGDLRTYDKVSSDIFTFAQAAYEEYANQPSKVVGFRVDRKINKKDKSITFTGRYGAVDHKISVNINLLSNRRYKISITDLKTKLNIDSDLKSNSKRNQFIGILPVSADDYSIDYDGAGDGFIISLYPEESTRLNEAYTAAESRILSGLGIGSLSDEKVDIIRSGNSLAP